MTSNGATIKDSAYLPGFWLPDEGLWAEVKGKISYDDLSLLVNATIPHWGLPPAPNSSSHPDTSRAGDRLLLLGPIPNPAAHLIPTHSVLAFWKGDVFRRPAWLSNAGRFVVEHQDELVGNDGGDLRYPTDRWGSLTEGAMIVAGEQVQMQRLAHLAYEAARQARFEHGDTGVPRPRRPPPTIPVEQVETAIAAVPALHQLETVDGRVSALRYLAPMIAGIADDRRRKSLVDRAASVIGFEDPGPVIRLVNSHRLGHS
ncbi:hypothetical protein ACIBXA_31330 [Micromonospora echinaurantiaca]|uniref:hypothetical protein n=1 Tax=Micromonospora echinaurantiaca TaxID=47857 RepID=UPI0037B856AD